MRFIEYLQQSSSIYAIIALDLNTTLGLTVKDIVENFRQEGYSVNIDELKARWLQLENLGFAQKEGAKNPQANWRDRAQGKIGYVLTRKGRRASKRLIRTISFIGVNYVKSRR